MDFLFSVDYGTIALNWTLDVSDSDTAKQSKKRKGESKSNANVDVFPKELDQAFRNIVAVSIYVTYHKRLLYISIFSMKYLYLYCL